MALRIKYFHGFSLVRSDGQFSSYQSVTTPEGEVFEQPYYVKFSQVYLPKYSVWIFLLLCLALFAGSAYFVNKQNNVDRYWKSAKAQIVSNERVEYRSDGKKSSKKSRSPGYQAIFQFQGDDGVFHTYKGKVDSKAWQLGHIESIKYNPQAPDNVVREGEPQPIVGAWLLGIMGVASLATSLIVAIWGPFDKVTVAVNERVWTFKRGQYHNSSAP